MTKLVSALGAVLVLAGAIGWLVAGLSGGRALAAVVAGWLLLRTRDVAILRRHSPHDR